MKNISDSEYLLLKLIEYPNQMDENCESLKEMVGNSLKDTTEPSKKRIPEVKHMEMRELTLLKC